LVEHSALQDSHGFLRSLLLLVRSDWSKFNQSDGETILSNGLKVFRLLTEGRGTYAKKVVEEYP